MRNKTMYVVHNKEGKIIVLTVPYARPGTGIDVQLKPGETFLELELPEHFANLSLADIQKDYRVDREKKELVRRS